MRVNKAESALGRSNYEKICKFIDGNEIDCLPVNHHLYDFLSKLESGYNFNDVITETLLYQSAAIVALQKQCIDSAIMNGNPNFSINKGN